ncbi:MAG: cysteine desulfurase family protein [Enterococcus sp.]
MYYFDYAATAPMTEKAQVVLFNAQKEFWGNPSSLHEFGQKARQLIEYCRKQTAQALGILASELIFTSGGSESNELALACALKKCRLDAHILVSPLEHASIFHYLHQQGRAFEYLTLDQGQVTPESLKKQLQAKTQLVIVQQVNSVTGVIQPIEELLQVLPKQVMFHCDCVQSLGKMPLPQGVTSWSGASHKFGGGKGVGYLYLNQAAMFVPKYDSTQETGFRNGTENVPAIAAATEALLENLKEQGRHALRYEGFKQLLKKHLPNWEMVDIKPTYGGICGIYVPDLKGETVVVRLGEKQVMLSTSSACQTHRKVDSALTALGVNAEKGERYLRISFGPAHQTADVLFLAQCLQELNYPTLQILSVEGGDS